MRIFLPLIIVWTAIIPLIFFICLRLIQKRDANKKEKANFYHENLKYGFLIAEYKA